MKNNSLNNNWLKMIITILCVVMISIPLGFTFYENKINDIDVDGSTDYEMDNYKSVRARNTRAGEDWPGIWTTKAPMSIKRNGLGVADVNNKIYAIGGRTFEGVQNLVEEYNPATDAWTTKQPMPTARSHFAIGVVNNKIYVVGGLSGGNVTEEYNPATDTWTTKASMPTPRFWFSIGVVNNKIYAIGGDDGEMNTLDIVEEYNPLTDSWITKASMPTPRAGLAVGVVAGKIYAIGGQEISSLNTTEMYDPGTDTWFTKTPMPTARSELAVGVMSGKIYAIGKWTTNEEYNPTTDTWSTKADMPTPRESFGVGVVNNKIYAIGGQDTSKKVNVNEEFTLNLSIDSDFDSLTNLQEFLNGTDPHNNDTDGDNLGDGFELTFSKTNPANWDTDGDGIGDGLEFLHSQGYVGSMQSLPNDWIGMTITWDNYTIFIKTSSSILEGEFEKENNKLTIKISGPKGTKGETDIDVPKALCQPENISIKFDGDLLNYNLTQNATYYHIHIEYNHSIHELMADFSYSGVVPNGQIDDEPKDEDDDTNYFYIIALIIVIIIIIIILIVVIKTRNNKVTNDIPELPPHQLSTLLEAKRAKGEMTDETYNDIKSKLKKYQDR